MDEPESTNSNMNIIKAEDVDDPPSPIPPLINGNSAPVTPQPFEVGVQDILDQVTNSIQSTTILNEEEKILYENYNVIPNRSAESPSFSSYFRFRKPSTPVLSVDPLILSPLEDVGVSNGPHSPIFPMMGSYRTGYHISHPQNETGSDFILPPENSAGADSIHYHNPEGDSAHPLPYPQTPQTSVPPPLFDKLYYSPVSSSRTLFAKEVDGNSDLSLRDMRLTLQSPIFDSENGRSDDMIPLISSPKSVYPAEKKKNEDSSVFHFGFNSKEKVVITKFNDTNKESRENDDMDEDGSSYEEDDISAEKDSTQSNHKTTRSFERNDSKKSKKSLKRAIPPSEIPPSSQVVSQPTVTSELGIVPHPCNCKKSRCLKLYCECFSSNVYCNGCNCMNCLNNPAHMKEREEAKQLLLERNANAFKPRVVKDSQSKTVNLKGCNCKKTGCLKKYCECYQSGIPCGENCHCIDCRNTEEAALFTSEKSSKLTEGLTDRPLSDEDFTGSN